MWRIVCNNSNKAKSLKSAPAPSPSPVLLVAEKPSSPLPSSPKVTAQSTSAAPSPLNENADTTPNDSHKTNTTTKSAPSKSPAQSPLSNNLSPHGPDDASTLSDSSSGSLLDASAILGGMHHYNHLSLSPTSTTATGLTPYTYGGNCDNMSIAMMSRFSSFTEEDASTALSPSQWSLGGMDTTSHSGRTSTPTTPSTSRTSIVKRVSYCDDPTRYSSSIPSSSASNVYDPDFCVELHQVLSAREHGKNHHCLDHILSWNEQSNGQSFTIHDCDKLEAEVLPKFFRNSTIESFGQHLSLYGFERVEQGEFAGDYYQEDFRRGKRGSQLARKMNPLPGRWRAIFGGSTIGHQRRRSGKAASAIRSCRGPVHVRQVQVHHQLPKTPTTPHKSLLRTPLRWSATSGSGSPTSSINDTPLPLHQHQHPYQHQHQHQQYPTTLSPSPGVATPRSLQYQEDMQASSNTSEELLDDFSFPAKLHRLLTHTVPNCKLDHIISWRMQGTCFVLYDKHAFDSQGLAELVGTTNHSSFRVQLFLHGFQRMHLRPRGDGDSSHGDGNAEAFRHEDFHRAIPQLARRIRSRNVPKKSLQVLRTTNASSRSSGTFLISTSSHSRSGTNCSSDTSDGSRRPWWKKGLAATRDLPAPDMAKLCALPNLKMTLDPMSNGGDQGSHQNLGVLEPETLQAKEEQFAAVPKEAPVSERSAAKLPRRKVEALRKSLKPRNSTQENFFPVKLHAVLKLVHELGMEHLVSWQPHGRCFKVHDLEAFEVEILPMFHHGSFASFRSQLRAYSFTRLVKKGPDHGCYFSEFFLRGFPHLVANIQRRPKTIMGKKRGRPRTGDAEDPEPNFYKIPFLPEPPCQKKAYADDWRSNRPGSIRCVLESALAVTAKPVTESLLLPPGPCRVIELDGETSGIYRDYFVRDETAQRKPQVNQETEKLVSGDHVFLGKLHDLLSCAKEKHVEHIISWQPHGRCFLIRDSKAFEEDLCCTWFGLSKYTEFKCLLLQHGFRCIASGRDYGGYYHEMFLCGLRTLITHIQRRQSGEANANANDDSSLAVEPDFYELRYLTDQRQADVTSFTSSPAERELEVAMALTTMEPPNSLNSVIVDELSFHSDDSPPVRVIPVVTTNTSTISPEPWTVTYDRSDPPGIDGTCGTEGSRDKWQDPVRLPSVGLE